MFNYYRYYIKYREQKSLNNILMNAVINYEDMLSELQQLLGIVNDEVEIDTHEVMVRLRKMIKENK